MEFVALGIVAALAVVYFLLWNKIRKEQNGFRADLTEVTVGQLTNQVVHRKGKGGSFEDEPHKKTQVTYTYQVNEVNYRCDCTVIDRFKPMPASTKVVYQRKDPKMAYMPEFEEPDVKGMSSFYLSGTILFVLMAVLFLIFAL